jgi:hypothetical protein
MPAAQGVLCEGIYWLVRQRNACIHTHGDSSQWPLLLRPEQYPGGFLLNNSRLNVRGNASLGFSANVGLFISIIYFTDKLGMNGAHSFFVLFKENVQSLLNN